MGDVLQRKTRWTKSAFRAEVRRVFCSPPCLLNRDFTQLHNSTIIFRLCPMCSKRQTTTDTQPVKSTQASSSAYILHERTSNCPGYEPSLPAFNRVAVHPPNPIACRVGIMIRRRLGRPLHCQDGQHNRRPTQLVGFIAP